MRTSGSGMNNLPTTKQEQNQEETTREQGKNDLSTRSPMIGPPNTEATDTVSPKSAGSSSESGHMWMNRSVFPNSHILNPAHKKKSHDASVSSTEQMLSIPNTSEPRS